MPDLRVTHSHHNSESKTEVSVVGITAGSTCRAAFPRRIQPAASSQKSLPGQVIDNFAVYIRATNIRSIAAPFPDIPVHVIKAPWVGAFLTDRMRATSLDYPCCHTFGDVSTRIRKNIASNTGVVPEPGKITESILTGTKAECCFGIRSTSEFPFCFCWQAINSPCQFFRRDR